MAYRLYPPQVWTTDTARRKKAGVPEQIGFQTKIEIALDQIRMACAMGLPRGAVLMDAGYGNHCDLRSAITALDLPYVAGILSNTTVWAPGTGPLPPKPSVPGRGRPTKRLRRDGKHRPVKVKDIAFNLPAKAWRTITWRQGSNELLKSRFARLRLSPNAPARARSLAVRRRAARRDPNPSALDGKRAAPSQDRTTGPS